MPPRLMPPVAQGHRPRRLAAGARLQLFWLAHVCPLHAPRCRRDTDPDGVQLAAVADPLAEAAKLLRRLREHAGDQLAVQQLSFEVRPARMQR